MKSDIPAGYDSRQTWRAGYIEGLEAALCMSRELQNKGEVYLMDHYLEVLIARTVKHGKSIAQTPGL